MIKYDRSIIDLYASKREWYNLDFIDMINGYTTWYRDTGEVELDRSKYWIVNIWRKITKTEKYKTIIESTTENPYK